MDKAKQIETLEAAIIEIEGAIAARYEHWSSNFYFENDDGRRRYGQRYYEEYEAEAFELINNLRQMINDLSD